MQSFAGSKANVYFRVNQGKTSEPESILLEYRFLFITPLERTTQLFDISIFVAATVRNLAADLCGINKCLFRL